MCQSRFSSPPGCLLHSSTEQQPPQGQGARAAGSAAPGPQLQLLGVCAGVLAAAASRSFSSARRSGPPSRCRPRAGAAPRPGSRPSSWPAELVLLAFSQCSRRSTSPGRSAAAGAVVGICSTSSVPTRDLIAATAESHGAGPELRREPRAQLLSGLGLGSAALANFQRLEGTRSSSRPRLLPHRRGFGISPAVPEPAQGTHPGGEKGRWWSLHRVFRPRPLSLSDTSQSGQLLSATRVPASGLMGKGSAGMLLALCDCLLWLPLGPPQLGCSPKQKETQAISISAVMERVSSRKERWVVLSCAGLLTQFSLPTVAADPYLFKGSSLQTVP